VRTVILMLLGLGALVGCDDSGQGTYARGLGIMTGDGDDDAADGEPLRPRQLPDPPLAGDGDGDGDGDAVAASPRPRADVNAAGDGDADTDAGARDRDAAIDEAGEGDEDAAVPDPRD
jgi:hypothetical protein